MLGAALVALFYLLVGGRVFCSWVCPVNMVTDAAHWLRGKLGLKGRTKISRITRYGLLAAVMILAAATGLFLVLAVFVLDLAVSPRAWCGYLCPMGAFYSLLGQISPLRVRASNRAACDSCMDCFEVCPEPQVINPALFGEKNGTGPVIDDGNCTNCGRCIDVCSKKVFTFGTRFNHNVNMLSEQEEART